METKFQAPVQLSDVQAQVLLLVMSAPTPAAAVQTMRTSEKAALAGKILNDKGLVASSADGIAITDKGLEMLDRMNIIDKQGKRTPYGEQLFTKAVELNNTESRAFESAWPLLSLVSQRV